MTEEPRRKVDEPKKKKDVKGEGFVMKGESYTGEMTGQETWLEMRKGETTDKATEAKKRDEAEMERLRQELKEKEAKMTPEEKRKRDEERAKQEREVIVDWFENMLHQRERGGKYSETLLLNPDRSLDRKKRADGFLPYIISIGDLKTPDDLYQLLHKISEEYPELNISIETDPKWKWIKYEVTKKSEK